MIAADVMARLLVTVGPEATLHRVVGLMLKHRISGLPVVDADGKLLGILTESDLLRRAGKGGWTAADCLAGDAMSTAVICVAPDTPLEQVSALMEAHDLKRLPVVSGGRLDGMVSRANLIQALLRQLPVAGPAPRHGHEGAAAAEDAAQGGSLSLVGAKAFELDADIGPLGIALVDMLNMRKSQRLFSSRDLSRYRLSRLLWAAFGINRPAERCRTAPSVSNAQEIDVYVAMASGWYRYDAAAPSLILCGREDIRAATGKQDFVASAPVNLLYVANLERLASEDHAERLLHAGIDAGHISQNVYLFCAAEGMATVARAWFDQAELASVMGLLPAQRVILAQTVGYPATQPAGPALPESTIG
ncbi:CBS domain-containing protein [Pseudoduganella aquatica]|uniref:CBS domain-containing protein n=1 Tax=Pseudoduganella aquatica TaxID=2660641 RepID=A0A7X4H8S4_9BURK|nr:CBS domain-containing protein [Pseudoduganella aquatica]MYN06765.1 CBS domain-containing protein [Pseudoduganella aquatica]